MTAPIAPPALAFSANLRPVLVMEPALVPVFEQTGAPFSVIGDVGWTELDAALRRALEHLSPSRAAAEVADALNLPRKRAYARALELSK